MSNIQIDVPAAKKYYEEEIIKLEAKMESDLRWVTGNNGVNMRSLVDTAENCLTMMSMLAHFMETLGLPSKKLILESSPDTLQQMIFDHFGYKD